MPEALAHLLGTSCPAEPVATNASGYFRWLWLYDNLACTSVGHAVGVAFCVGPIPSTTMALVSDSFTDNDGIYFHSKYSGAKQESSRIMPGF